MRFLADVNIWVSLVMLDHSRHERTLTWFENLTESDEVCFCRATQQGFLRLTTDQSIFKEAAVSNKQAWEAYRILRNRRRVGWVDEPEGLEEIWIQHAGLSTSSPRVWMDAYLIAIAKLHGLRLITFDRGFRAYKNLDWIDLGAIK